MATSQAAIDTALLHLRNAEWHIARTTHMNCKWTFTRDDVIAVQDAIGILRAAAKRIVSGEEAAQ